jgi:hypothetical protein
MESVRLTEELGGKVVKLKGRRVADALIEFARSGRYHSRDLRPVGAFAMGHPASGIGDQQISARSARRYSSGGSNGEFRSSQFEIRIANWEMNPQIRISKFEIRKFSIPLYEILMKLLSRSYACSFNMIT